MKWLSLFGVKNFKTQEPSDLEYDPQLRVVAEWRDPDTLFHDHIDNAIVEIMLEKAEKGKKLGYNRWMLPIARVVKGYSMIKNQFGGFGPLPEGMSATAGLRNEQITAEHLMIKKEVLKRTAVFKKEHSYTASYFQMLRITKEMMKEMNY